MPLAVLRVDASREIGAGHLARCVALGLALEDEGWTPVLASTRETQGILPVPPWRRVVLAGNDPASEPAAIAAAIPEGADILLVDHYRRGAAFEGALRPWARRILAIEDLADRRHDCDFLLDSTPLRRATEYDDLVPASAARLVGAAYAPLRAGFARERWRRPVDAGEVSTIHLSLGATDPGGHLGTVLDGIEASGFRGRTIVSLSPAAAGYREACTRVDRLGGVVLPADAGMAAAMAACDLAIGAGGVGMLERACLGLPQVLVEVASNQRANLAAMARAGACIVVGPPEAGAVARAVRAVLEDGALREHLGRCGAALCDGLGARRVALEASAGRWRLRLATEADRDVLLEWQLEPGTRRFARDPRPPTPETHRAWIDARLADRRCVFLVMEEDAAPCASVRLDWRKEEEGFEISLVVAPAMRGQGHSVRALSLARRLVAGEDLLAHVQAANEASLRSFERAGYVPAGRPDWYVSRGARQRWDSA